jgi:hypothetical protein
MLIPREFTTKAAMTHVRLGESQTMVRQII